MLSPSGNEHDPGKLSTDSLQILVAYGCISLHQIHTMHSECNSEKFFFQLIAIFPRLLNGKRYNCL